MKARQKADNRLIFTKQALTIATHLICEDHLALAISYQRLAKSGWLIADGL
jgi:hypothetical protein